MIATAGTDCVTLWQYNPHSAIDKFQQLASLPVSGITKGVFNFNDTKLILLTDHQSAGAGRVIVVDIASHTTTEICVPYNDLPPKEIVASCVDTKFVTFAYGCQTAVWMYDTNSPEAPIASFRLKNPYPPCFSPDLSSFVTGRYVYNLQTEFDEQTAFPIEILHIETGGNLDKSWSCFADDGTMFCAFLSHSTCIWDASRTPWKLQHQDVFSTDYDPDDDDETWPVEALRFNPSKTTVVAYFKDEALRAWPTLPSKTRRCTRYCDYGVGLFITADDVVLFGSDSGIDLFDITLGIIEHEGTFLHLNTTDTIVLGGTPPRVVLL